MEIETIKQLVNKNTKVNIDTRRRHRDIVEARALYYKLCREYTFKSLSEIGKSVSRDHATVLWGLKNFENWANQNVALKSTYLNIKTKIETIQAENIDSNQAKQDFINRWLKVKEDNESLVITNQELVKELKMVTKKLKKRNDYFKKNGYIIN